MAHISENNLNISIKDWNLCIFDGPFGEGHMILSSPQIKLAHTQRCS
jgi:hypothetical protein